MELRDLGGALWRQRALALLVVVVVALSCAVGVLLAPKTYTATAVVEAPADPAVADVDPARLEARRVALAAMSRSESVLATAAEETGVDAAVLGADVEASWRRGTDRVEVSVRASTPRTAVERADAVARALAMRSDDDLVLVDGRRAVLPETWSSPDLALVALVAAVLAIVTAAAGAGRRDARSRTVADGAALESAASAPLLAHVLAPDDASTMPAMSPGTAGAAVFTRLMNAVQTETARQPVDLVVIAGVGLGEVAPWIGANLAMTYAGAGRSVLLVDARLGDQYGTPGPGGPDTVGLREVLGGAALGAGTSAGPVPGLTVLPAGRPGSESPARLIEVGLATFLEQARARFDVVLMVAPPLDLSDDARALAAGAALLMTVAEDRLTPTETRAHADRVRAAGGRLIGTVLVSPQRAAR